jgi:broad specificity phosphatase PhoE
VSNSSVRLFAVTVRTAWSLAAFGRSHGDLQPDSHIGAGPADEMRNQLLRDSTGIPAAERDPVSRFQRTAEPAALDRPGRVCPLKGQ